MTVLNFIAQFVGWVILWTVLFWITMRLGLWLIGVRETPKEKALDCKCAEHSLNYRAVANGLDNATSERDVAIKEREELKVINNLLDSRLNQMQTQVDAAYKKLNSHIEQLKKQAAKTKRKPTKSKRVKK